MVRVALVTNIPAPYRIPMWGLLAADRRIDLTVIFCAGKEPNREWDLDELKFKSVFLNESYFTAGGSYIHNNVDIMRQLRAISPDVVITTGFSPTFVYAFLYTWWNRRKHICLTDGTFASEAKLSVLHRCLRAIMFKRSVAFIGASGGSRQLYRSWNIPTDRIFISPLCIDNKRFGEIAGGEKTFDLIFCGRFAEEKQPLFVFDVAERTAALLGRSVSVLFVGSGELEPKMRVRACHATAVVAKFHGFARQAELPKLYPQARVFLFPTLGDVWGIVANEACASGLPIISTPFAGAVGEIIKNDINGFVLDPDADQWAEKLQRLLTDDPLYKRFSGSSLHLVADYNYETAADGVMRAILRACQEAPTMPEILT